MSRDCYLLAFVGVLEQKLTGIAVHFGLPAFVVHAVCELHGLELLGFERFGLN